MPVYNIVLNAENKVAGGTNASCLYNFDWGILPRGEYKVTFSYQGGANSIHTVRFATLSVDLGQSKNFTTSSTVTITPSTRIIGYLQPYNITASTITNASYLISTYNNTPVYLSNPPSNQTFLVQVSNPDGTPYTDSLNAVNASYVLILSFELIR